MREEIIKLQVRVRISHDENDPESKKYAINIAKQNVVGISTHGYPESAEPLTSKLIK